MTREDGRNLVLIWLLLVAAVLVGTVGAKAVWYWLVLGQMP